MVNYNNSQISINCCESILDQTNNNHIDIIIVDNGSVEKEQILLRNYAIKYDNIYIVETNANVGYFPGIKIGQKYAYNLMPTYDFMLIANNDLIYLPNFFSDLCSRSYEDDVMIISPDIIRMDGIHQNPLSIKPYYKGLRKIEYDIFFSNWYVQLFALYILKLLNGKKSEKNRIGFNKEQYIYVGFGACFILTKKFIDVIKYVDDSSFLMGEETLLTLQVQKYCGKVLYMPSLKVRHMDSATFKSMPSRFAYENMRKAFNLYKRKLR